jgi:tetratricopeptide (TPR) repeat protein
VNFTRFRTHAAWLAAAVAAAAALAAHWPVVYNGLLGWDDMEFVRSAEAHAELSLRTIRWAFRTVVVANYHPLTLLSHAMDCWLWGREPFGHHLSSLALHAVNSALVVAVVWWLGGFVPGLSAGRRLALATGVGVAFGIHPVQVESVAWVAERKNLLCAFFSLICVGAYLRSVGERSSRGWRLAVAVSYLAAWLSKPMAVSLPAVLLALDYYPLRRWHSDGWRRLLAEKSALIGLMIAGAAMTLWVHHRAAALVDLDWMRWHHRLLLAARNSMFYLRQLAWPVELSPHYPLQTQPALMTAEYLSGAAGFCAATALAWRLRRRAPQLLAGWAAYVAFLLPVSGLVTLGTIQAADRYMYLAMIPVALMVACGVDWLWRTLNLPGRLALGVLLACYGLFLGLSSFGQTAVWFSDETVWRAAAQRFPDSYVAHHQLAAELLRQQQLQEARAHATKSLEVAPSFSKGRALLGAILLRLEDWDAAATQLDQAVRLEPRLGIAWYYRAALHARRQDWPAAFESLQRALAADPSLARHVPADDDLAALREHPEYAGRVRALLAP